MSLCFPCDLMVSHAGQLPPVNAQQFIAFPESSLGFYSALLKQSGEAATHSTDGPDIRVSGAVWQEMIHWPKLSPDTQQICSLEREEGG